LSFFDDQRRFHATVVFRFVAELHAPDGSIAGTESLVASCAGNDVTVVVEVDVSVGGFRF
jgi:hypothetical protein